MISTEAIRKDKVAFQNRKETASANIN